MGQDLSERCHFSHPGREGGSGFWCDLDSYRWMRHTACVSSFLGNRYMNLFLYKETHFFGFIQFSSLLAQLCYLVAHPVGTVFPRADEDHHLRVHSCCQTSLQIVLPNTATREASCYQTAPSTVDLFGNRSTSCGPAPCRCWVTAAYSARESSLCRRSRQSTSIAWYGMSRRAAMRFTPFLHVVSVGTADPLLPLSRAARTLHCSEGKASARRRLLDRLPAYAGQAQKEVHRRACSSDHCAPRRDRRRPGERGAINASRPGQQEFSCKNAAKIQIPDARRASGYIGAGAAPRLENGGRFYRE